MGELEFCDACEGSIPAAAARRHHGSRVLCPECWRLASAAGTGKPTRQAIALCGAAVLFIGVFVPIVSMPFVGSINYFQNGKGDGVLVLVAAGATVALALKEKYRGLWITGLGALGVLLFTFIRFQVKLSDMRAETERELAGNPFRGIGDAMLAAVQLQWGWAVLVLGSILVLVAARRRDSHI